MSQPTYELIHDAITEEEEIALLATIYKQPWHIGGISRATQHYGYIYDYKTTKVSQPLPTLLPKFITNLTNAFYPDADQWIINRYLPGEGIADHKDSKVFHDKVMSLSLGSDCLFFIDGTEILLKRRDLLIMNRRVTHGIRPRKTDKINGKNVPRSKRISITFRRVI